MAEYQGGGDSVIYNMFTPILGIMQANDERENKRRQQERQARDKMTQDLSKDLYKINSAGLREKDIPEFQDNMNRAREEFYLMGQAGSREQMMQHQIKVNEYLAEASRIKDLSKSVADKFGKFSDSLSRGVGKMDTEKATAHFKALQDKKSTDITEGELDLSKYYYTYDKTKIDNSLHRMFNKAIDNPQLATTDRVVTPEVRSGGKIEDRIANIKTISDDTAFKMLSDLARTDKNFDNYLTSLENENGISRNDAIMLTVDENRQYLSKSEETLRGADRPRDRVINNNMGYEETPVTQNVFRARVGAFSSDETIQYEENISLLGERDVYFASDGKKVDEELKGLEFEGSIAMQLPVDSNGRPLPTNNQNEAIDPSKVAGYGNFMVGRAVQPADQHLQKVYQNIVVDYGHTEMLIPLSQTEFLGRSKALQEGKQNLQNRARTNSSGGTGSAPRRKPASASIFEQQGN